MNVHVPPGGDLAGYRVERVLGRGGMSVVYLATDPQLGRRVALKVLAQELSEDERFRERFLRESQLAAGLDHPRIVPVYAAGEADGLLYIAMRYVEGEDLRQLLRREGPLAPPRALALVAQVADALDAAHEAGLVHRDVKPGNVLLARRRGAGGEEHAYLADFGLAKRPATVASATGAGLAGTIAYAAPEQIEGGAVDGRADVYALGCLLYECLAGVPPFVRESELAVVFAHLQEPPPRLTDARPELPPGIDAVLRTALAKKPAQRYATCGALVEAARAALPATTAPGPAPSRGPLALAAAGGAALLAAAVGVVVYATRGGSKATPPVAAARASLRAPASSLALIDPRTDRVTAFVRLRDVPSRVVASGNAIWAASADGKSLTRVDPRTRRVVDRLDLQATPTGLAPGTGGSVWVALGLANQLVHVTPSGGGGYVLDRIPIRRCCAQPTIVTTSGSAVWIADAAGTHRVDPASATVGPATPGTGSAGAVALTDGSVWVADGWDRLSHVMSAGKAPPPIAIDARGGGPGQPTGLAFDGTNVWTAGTQANAAYRIDTITGAVTRVTVGDSPSGVDAAASGIWVSNAGDGTVSRIDPIAARVVKTIAVGPRVAAVAATARAVWVAVQAASAATGASGVLAVSPYPTVIRADGRQLASLAHLGDTFQDRTASWAADGSRLVFERVVTAGAAKAYPHLFTIRPDGTGLRQLTHGAVADINPAWSPDGRRIAFERAASIDQIGFTSRIWVMRADGTRPQPVGPACDATHPTWSPDGGSIVLACGTPAPRRYEMRADGTGAHPLPTPAAAAVPALAPDGLTVAYAGDITDTTVHLTSVRASSATTLAQLSANDEQPTSAWSPDGTRIAFGDSNGLYVAYADGNGLTPLASSGIPAWRPTR